MSEEERLMKTPEEVRQKVRELLQMPKEEVLTKYMFQEQEIERLNENNQAMQGEMARTWKKLDEKENIIKEVREYVEENLCYSNCDGMKYIIPSGKDILEILDKENK